MWPFSKSESADVAPNRKKDGRTKSGFKKRVEESPLGKTITRKSKMNKRDQMLKELEKER